MATENCNSEKRRRVRNPPPLSTISKLEQDLLFEVLIRVPDPRSACHCKLVCERWNSLISGPYFNRRFLAHRRSKNGGGPSLLIASNDPKAIILSFLPVPNDSAEVCFRVFDSFKDLVLCGFWALRESDPGIFRSLFVCNPFTEQWVALPLMPEKSIDVHMGLIARLVCEPCCNRGLDLGDDEVFVYSDYRFRVVCIYQESPKWSTKLDVFCSESGKWTEEALVLDRDFDKVVSCNGGLYWFAWDDRPILRIDPFHLDRPPTSVDGHPGFKRRMFNLSVSQGILHVVLLEDNIATWPLLTVWRQEVDEDDCCVSWRELYRVWLKEPSSKSCDYVRGVFYFACLHPDKPEIVFLQNFASGHRANILYHNVTTGEESVFAEISCRWTLFQPRVSCWPTPIPNYEKLRGAYDGIHSCWAQQAPAPKQLLPPSRPSLTL